jgi:hypothetical protein
LQWQPLEEIIVQRSPNRCFTRVVRVGDLQQPPLVEFDAMLLERGVWQSVERRGTPPGV